MTTISTIQELPPHVRSCIEVGVQNAGIKWQVELPETINFNFKHTEGRLTGNRNLATKTKLTYYHCFQQLWRFCAWVGDYESMLIMLYPAIKKFPSINNETVDLFIRFKALPKGEAIDTLAQAVDIFGNPFDATGEWRCPKQIGKFCSAMNTLHCIHDMHRCAYHDVCNECVIHSNGCVIHSPNRHLYRRGNPINNEFVRNTVNEVKNPNYEYNGASQLLPNQI